MTKPRSEQVSLSDTPFYHCVVRCVRQAFLCGTDSESGRNFDHRKQWVVSRLRFLSSVFAIDLCAYSVMSNHYHAVLHVDIGKAQSWSDKEVISRWKQLFSGSVLVDSWSQGQLNGDYEIKKATEIIQQWRDRLMSISWFMRCVNETIATKANNEDNCKGRFWEGRFKSQALLDEAALLTCMAYVDLNPVRAGIADTPENSDFTSIQQRLYDCIKYSRAKTTRQKTLRKRIEKQCSIEYDLTQNKLKKAPLAPFYPSVKSPAKAILLFTREDYFRLVDQTGRVIRGDKKGSIEANIQPILSRLRIDERRWLEHMQSCNQSNFSVLGEENSIRKFARRIDKQWLKGIGLAKTLFGTTCVYSL